VGYLSPEGEPTFKYGLTGEGAYAQIDWALDNLQHDLLHLVKAEE
jgi:hypothetical protein